MLNHIILCVAVAGCTLLMKDAAAQVPILTVALSGQQAPGVEPGLTFGAILGPPTINNAGQVAFNAVIMHGNTSSFDRAIWVGTQGSLSVVRASAKKPQAAEGLSTWISIRIGHSRWPATGRLRSGPG